MEFTYYLPTRIVFGRGSIEKLGEEARRLGGVRALLVTTGNLLDVTGYSTVVSKSLTEAGIEYRVFSEVEENPSIETCERGAKIAREAEANVVIAFGGGSAIDAGKAISVLASLGGSARDYLFPKQVEAPTIPVIAIPTTCGTGAEVTRYALLSEISAKKKVVMAGPSVIPRVALLDPNVLKNIPRRLLAWTALDALSHSIESYVSKTATPISDGVALESIYYVLRCLLKAYEGDEEAKARLHIAATLGGIAINTTGTTLIHAIGYYLTMYHNVHHGLANALVMPYVLEYNLKYIDAEKVGVLLRVTGDVSVRDFIARINEIMDSVGIPESIAEVGVRDEELDAISSEALGYRRNINANPAPVDARIVKELVSKALKGRSKVYG